MRPFLKILGFILLLGGTTVVVYAMYFALRDFASIYDNAINTPLDEPHAADGAVGEKAISQAMFRYVVIGAMGVPPMIIGSAILTTFRVRKLLARSNKRTQRLH